MAQETPRFLESPLGALATELEAENAAAPRIPAPSLPQFDPAPQQPQQQAPQQAGSRRAGALPNDPRLVRAFQDASRRHGVPINVLMALAQQESSYNTYALGQPTQYGRAKGIMQYLDSTAQGVGINPFDAEQAIDAAARQYADRIRRGDTPLEAIMAHHGGDNRRQWGPRTQAYGQQVMQRAQDILGAYQQAFPPQPEPAQPQQPQQQAAAPAAAPASEPTRSWGEVFTDPAKKFAGSLVGMAGGVIDMLAPDPAPGETGYLDRVRRRVEDANAGIDGAIASAGEYFGLGGLDAIREARERSTQHEQQRTRARAQHDAVAAAEGRPSLDERRRQNPVNRVADEISGFGDYLRTDAVSEAQRFHDQNLGRAVDSGFAGAARYAVTNPIDFASSVGPETLSYLIPAAGAARITGAAAKAARVPAALAERLAGGAGLAAVGGAATIQNATGVAMEIMDMPEDELRRTSPLFVELVDQQGLTPTAAKSEMADRAFMRTLTVSGVSNAVTLGVAARFRANVLENWAMGRLGAGAGAGGARGAAAGAASGFTKEALSEMAQEGGDAVAQGIGEVGGGVRRQEDMFAQVPGSMAVGALASAPGGAVAGAYEGGRRAPAPATEQQPQAPAPATQAAPPAQEPPIAVGTAGRDTDTTPGGTIGRAAQAGQQAAVQAGIEAGLNEDQPAPRVTARTPLEGDVAGTLESYREDGKGGWQAAILGDDGQLRHYTDEDGVELVRQDGAAQPAAEPQAPAAQPQVAPEAQAVTPEPAADTAAQIAAIRDPSSGKDAALITPNSARDADLSGLEAVETAQGLFVTSNPEKAAQARAAAGTLTTDQVGQLLGYTTPKAGSDGTVVQARDSQGNVVHQEATNQQRVAEATQRAEEMAPKGGTVETTTADQVQAERAQRVSEDNPLADFTDEDLRDRMRSIAAQVKAQGRTPILVNARRQVEQEINRRKAATKEATSAVRDDRVGGVEAASPAGAGKPAGRAADEVRPAARQQGAEEPVSAVPAAVAGAGAAADAQPALTGAAAPAADAHAGKWFGTQEKGDAYIAKKGIAGTHEVVAEGRRFEIRPKADPVAQAAAEAATSPANGRPEPTQAQKEAGNYAKGHISIGGLDISIENAAGTRRNPEWPPLEHAYGYVRGSKGADGDHVDVFLGDQATDTSRPVYVIDQVNEDRSFDEHKAVMGFTTAKDAKAAYLANYEDGWNGFGGMRKMSFEEFKGWVADPKRTAKPASAQVAAKPAEAAPSRADSGSVSAPDAEETAPDANAAWWDKELTPDARRSLLRAAKMDGFPDTILWSDIEPKHQRGLLKFKEAPDADHAVVAPKAEQASAGQFANNKLFTADAVEKARARMRSKLGQLNSGFDPELMLDGITITGAYIEAGVRDFASYAKAMTEDFGAAIRPYLLSFYEGVRNYPELDTEGMTPPAEAARMHAALVKASPATPEAAGQVVEPPKQRKKATGNGAGRTLRQDWGVESIDGWTPIEGGKNEPGDYGLRGGVKDAFLADAKGYLREVAAILEQHGLTPYPERGSKKPSPVSANPGGPAVSGDVILSMQGREGRGVYAQIGVSALRGTVPTTDAGISVMFRTTFAGNRYGSGTNQWARADLTAGELAELIRKEYERYTPAVPAPLIEERTNAGDQVRVAEGDAGARTEGVPAADAGRAAGADAGQAGGRARAESGRRDGRGDGQPEPAGQPAVPARSDEAGAGVRNPEAGRAGDRAEPGHRGNRQPLGDYRYQPGELTRDRSWRGVAERNVEAVELVKKLAAENRPATPDERALLARFTGWGASEIANGVFPDPRTGQFKADWRELGERLRAALTDEEYAAARRSTQYAHYTSEKVVRSIYGALERFGFAGGRVLEPGMGIGLFKGLMPDAISANSRYHGIEYDPITGAIAKALYPQSNIQVGDFTETALPKGYYDAAIGNPPFSSTKVLNDPEYRSRSFMLHDYFFAKTIDRVKPGGLVVFVTSKGTMDKANSRARQYLADRADLLGAIRLPQTAFKDNAGTEVVTDVLFLQRRAPGAEPNGTSWLGTREVNTPQGKTSINEYFADNPEMVLGRHALTGSMYRKDEYTVIPREGDIEQHFAEAVQRLPEGIYRPERGSEAERAAVADREFNPKAKKEGSVYIGEDGQLRIVDQGSGLALTERINSAGKSVPLKPKEISFLQSYVGLRDALKQSQYDQLNDGDWETSLAALNQAYDAFVKEHGHILAHSTSERENPDGTTTVITRWKNNTLLRLDAEDALVRALEEVRPDGTIVRGKLLTGRTLNKPTAPTINTVQDALLVQLNQQGRLDMAEVARLAGTTEKDAIEQLGDAIYNDPAKGWITADAYLSGNVVRKLKEARQAAKADPAMRRNVAALEAVQPAPLAPADISAQLGAHWVPASDVAAFASEVIGEKMDVSFHPLAKSWSVEATGGRAVSEWNTEGMPAADLLESTLNNRQIKVTRRVPDGNGGWTTEVDPVATEQANDVAKKMRTQFSRWLWASPQRAERLARFYNEHFNNIVPRSFDGQHLTLPGISSRFNLYPHQKRAIWRAIQDGNTYLAHSVGAGKTFTMIAAGMEERRLGLIKKPMYVVPNHMLAQFAREFQELYPTAHVMTADEDNFHTSVRRQFVARAALNDPDAIIITHSAFSRIGMSEEFSDRYIEDQIAGYQAIKEEAADDRITVKQAERRIEQLEKRLSGKTDASKKDKVLTFEELGVDRLYVDEFHEFRKLDFPTNRGSVKGIDPSGSQRSMDLHMKVQYLEGKNPGRSLVAASGTPVTNTMGELFTAQRFMQPAQLAEDGLDSFDAWSNQFGEVVEGFEKNPSGGYEIVSRFARFVNVPDLMRRVRSFMDILTSEQLGDLVQRPTVEGGGREIVVTPVPEGYKAYQKELDARIKAIRARKGKPQPGDDIILNVIGDGRFSAIDMRFVDPNAAPDPNSKLNRVLDDMIRAYHDTADWEYHTGGQPDQLRGAAMMLFTDIGLGEASAKNRGFDMKAWISKRLIDGGVAPEHIAFMRDNKAHAKKEKLFADMRQGKKRILIGGKDMETGVNAQKRLTDLFHLDAPWFPASVEQREGRIIRQGNQNKQVRVRAYATKGSYDSTMWGMNARKQRFITQALQGNDSIRSMEDVSEASSFEMASALASGDERYLKLAGLRADVERLGRLFSAHEREQRDMRSEKVRLESGIKARGALIAKLEDAISRRKPVSGDAFAATVDGAPVESREDFSNTLFMTFKELAEANTDGERVIGKIGGFNILYTGHTMKGSGDFVASVDLDIPGDPSALLTYPIDPELPVKGIAARATNQVNGLDRALSDTRARLAEMERRIEQVDSRIGAQFADMAELTEKQTALDELEAELASESQQLDQAQDEAAAAEADNPATPQQEEQQYQDIPDTILSGQVAEPRRVQALARLKVLRAQLQRGQIDEAAFVERVSALTDAIDNLRTGQRMRQAFTERARGADWLRERLIRARRNGELREETTDLGLWLLDQNPNLADDLGISIRAAKEGDSAGGYNKLERIASIFAGNENAGTAVHEILHHSERMMPPEVQDGIVREHRRAWEAAYRKAGPELKAALLDMAQSALGDRAAYRRVLEAFRKGTLDYAQHYPLVNASEYWAVNATDIMAGRHRVRGSWIGRARRWLGELVERAKGLFGLRSDAPVLRGLRRVMNGNGERLSSQMLAERAAGRQGQQYRDITDLEDIDLDGITFDTAQADFENNASGDSSASVEAINRLREERELGRVRLLIDRDGSVRPVLGVDAVDAVARDGQVIVQRGVGRDEWTVLSQGAGVSNELAQGKINRARAELAEAASEELEYRDINPQTQTPEFRRWFGDSKVVDEQGRPLVVYHGTGESFDTFDPARVGDNYQWSNGFYFSASADAAAEYAMEHTGAVPAQPGIPGVFDGEPADAGRGGANVMPVYLSIRNPLIRSARGYMSPDQSVDRNIKKWIAEARANGNDGLIVKPGAAFVERGPIYIAFRPEQIKSATGNAGTFDPSNQDIRFSVAPITAVEQEFRTATGEAPESAMTRLAGVEMRNGMRRAGNLAGELEASPYTPEQEALLDQYRAMKNPSSRYLFHTTTPDRLASIMASGLQPNSPQRFEGVSNGRISLSANEAAARYYGADGDVMLRLRKDYQIGDMESDLLAGGEGAYTTGTAIPPEALEIKRGNRWVKLSDATPDIRFSARQAGTASEAVTSGPFGAAVKRMIDAGQVQVHQQAPAGAPVGAQAWTDARGNIHLLDSVPAEIAPGVLLHEAFHGRVRPLIGEQAWSWLMGELTVLSRRAARDTGALGKAWTDAMERVQAARAQGDPNLMADAMTAEEFGAYAIENAENMPATVKTWAKRLLGAVQAWLLRRFGKQVGEVTPEQLRALAIAALRDAGMAQRTVTRGMEDVRLYSAEQREQALKAATDETVAEPAKAGDDWRGRLTRDISRLRNLLHHPRHIAAIFREFTPVYLTAMDQQSMRDNIITDLNRDYQNYAALPQEAKVRVNAVMELGRLLGKVYTAAELAAGVKNPGYRVAVRYDEQGQPIRYRRPFTATNSKAGELIQLSPEEVAAYGSMRAMFDRALDMFADQAIEEMGFPELRGNREKAKEMLKQMMAEGGNASRLSAAARFLADIEQAKRQGYVPFARYGDYVVAVKRDKANLTYVRHPEGGFLVRGVPHDMHSFMEAIGAKEDQLEDGWRVTAQQRRLLNDENSETLYAERIETGLRDMLPEARAKWLEGKARDIPAVKAAYERIKAQWAPEGSGNRILEPFAVNKKRPEDGVKLTDLDTLAGVADLDNETWNEVREKLADAIQAQGFRKHFFNADNVPGYTGDFERAITDYMGGMAGYLSRRAHQDRWDNSIKAIVADRLHAYALRYRDYVNSPGEELAALRQAGFLMYIGGSVASGVTNLTQLPMMTFPALGQFANPAKVSATMARASKDALAMMSAKRTVGLDLFDPKKAPADVRTDLVKAWESGDFVPQATFEIMATARNRTAGARRLRRNFDKGAQVFGLTFSVPERINRLTTYIAAYRLAQQPGFRERAAKVYGKNSLAQQMLFAEGKWSPAAFAEFMVDETQYRMGKANRPTIMRGLGAALLQFKGFMMQSLEAWSRMVRYQGKAGKLAAATSIAVMLALGGLWGFPGGEDARDLLEKLLEKMLNRDVDLRTGLRRRLYEATGSQWIAAAADRGIPYAFGLDMGRVGMGRIAPDGGASTGSDTLDSLLLVGGIPADMLIRRPVNAMDALRKGEPAGALAALAPTSIRNPIQAAQFATQGVRDSRGRVVMTPEQISSSDIVLKGLGWTPAQVTAMRDYSYAQYRMQTASDAYKARMADQIARTLALISRTQDERTRAELTKQLRETYAEVAAFNASAPAENQVGITNTMIRNRLQRELMGREGEFGRERRQARGASAEMREVYGVQP